MYKPDRKIKAQFRSYEGYIEEFEGYIEEIGIGEDGGRFTVSLEMSLGYFYTSLPIAHLEYRIENGNGDARIEQLSSNEVIIYDDSGRSNSFISEPDVIDVIMGEATLYKLR